jgi:hypothetical protein
MGIGVHAHGERSLQLTKASSMLARDALKHKEKAFEPLLTRRKILFLI